MIKKKGAISSEEKCRTLVKRLGVERHWPGLRCWMMAQAIFPQTEVSPNFIVGIWVEEMIGEGGDARDIQQFIDFAGDEWLVALRGSGGQPFALSPVLPETPDWGAAAIRRDEVAGFLDGLLNRRGDVPNDPAFKEAVVQLEAIEELLDMISLADNPAAGAVWLVIEPLTQAINSQIHHMTSICKAMAPIQ